MVDENKEIGSVHQHPGAGRHSVRGESVDYVSESFSLSLRKYVHQASTELHIPKSAVYDIFHNKLKLHAYKIQDFQK